MVTSKTAAPHKGDGHRKRLRERFLKSGLDGFHDYEIIELLLSLNTPRKDCKSSAKELLKRFKSLQYVMEASSESLCQVHGVGPANSFGIKLIKAVADRYHQEKIISRELLNNSSDLIKYLKQTIGHKTREIFSAIFLDAKNRVLTSEILFNGTLTQASVYPREVVIKALDHNAASIIFAHNHPSGDVTPSTSDIRITEQLYFALKFVGIIVHEHMIISPEGYFSFAEQGILSKIKEKFVNQHGK